MNGVNTYSGGTVVNYGTLALPETATTSGRTTDHAAGLNLNSLAETDEKFDIAKQENHDQQVYVAKLNNADPSQAAQVLQNMFGGNNGTAQQPANSALPESRSKHRIQHGQRQHFHRNRHRWHVRQRRVTATPAKYPEFERRAAKTENGELAFKNGERLERLERHRFRWIRSLIIWSSSQTKKPKSKSKQFWPALMQRPPQRRAMPSF